MKPATAATLAMLRAHPEGVTPLQALHAIGTMRLAARVWELRDAGYNVRSEDVTVEGKRFSRYVLVEAPVQLTMGVQ